MKVILSIFSGLALTSTALAGVNPSPVPEPGALELLAIGAIAGIAIFLRKRRK